jgi:hypothetical protein
MWHGVFLSFVFLFPPLFKRDFRLKKRSNALPSCPKRLAVRAVKAAQFAFIGAKRRALTEEAGGEAQSSAGRAGEEKLFRMEFTDEFQVRSLNALDRQQSEVRAENNCVVSRAVCPSATASRLWTGSLPDSAGDSFRQ